MSLGYIETIMQNLNTCNNWSVQLLNIKTSKKMGTGYSSREITLFPDTFLPEFISEIIEIYTGTGKKSIKNIQSVREYDGTADALTVYKLATKSPIISEEYELFLQTIADPDSENDPFEYTSAQLIKGEVTVQGESVPVKLISMQNPTTTLKHKLLHRNGSFRELSGKVLSLKPTIDLLIVGDTVYFMTLSGENLFNMARSYKTVCHQKVEDISRASIMSGYEEFRAVAESGHNPRRFVAYNEERLKALKRKSTRLAIAKQFSIPLDDSGERFDATKDGAAEKIVKLLCNKGMIDPFDKSAVEVDGARQWE